MEIDMTQFHQVFFEESLEGLNDMEQALLGLDLNNVDFELINTIFRAAHSIKGGSATFDFKDIAEFTHDLETLLEKMRSGDRPITKEAHNLFLISVDCMRNMFEGHQNGTIYDAAEVSKLSANFHRLLEEGSSSKSLDNVSDKSLNQTDEQKGSWQIKFTPEPYILLSGNEPLRIFRELASLGELTVDASCEKIPELDKIDVEQCYISWCLTLLGETTQESIEEVFEWIIDDCELIIKAPSELQSDGANQDATDTSTGVEAKSEGDTNLVVSNNENVQTAVSSAANAVAVVPTVEAVSSVKAKTSATIRVEIDKVDSLINLVGELVITQSMLNELGSDFDMTEVDRLQSGLEQLLQNTREIQESVMRIRMLPISNVFNRFPRMVHDMAHQLGKKIELKVTGEQTELDKTVMEQIGDPLVHLVRNSLDHGLENVQQRLDNNKSEVGTVFLNAYHQDSNIIIEVGDDGAGLNLARIRSKAIERGIINASELLGEQQIHDLLFQPGFSTAAVVSNISGRGVGMDVVKRNITSLGGTIEVESEEGIGSTFRIRLPLTLAILDGQLVKVGNETYIIPLISIIESLQVDQSQINMVSGNVELYRLRNENIPIIRTYKEFGIQGANQELNKALLVVVEGEGYKAALLVDDLMAQQQAVIKSLETNYIKVDGISGATILGNGKVALIIDVAGLIKSTRGNTGNPSFQAA